MKTDWKIDRNTYRIHLGYLQDFITILFRIDLDPEDIWDHEGMDSFLEEHFDRERKQHGT